MLDEAGWTECQISVSNSLDEYLIQDLLLQGAKIDLFGVGERMITAKSEPVFGGVYKLAAVEDRQGQHHPQDQDQRERGEDHHSPLQEGLPVLRQRHRQGHRRLHAPSMTRRWTTPRIWRSSTPAPPGRPRRCTTSPPGICWCRCFWSGKRVYDSPSLPEIQAYCRQQVDTLWDEVKRFDNPHTYYVDLSRQAVGHPAGSAPQSIISKKAELSDLADSSAWYPKGNRR